MRSWWGKLTGLVVVGAGLAVVSAPGVAQADPAFTLPSSPAGEITAHADIPVAEAPYLQVRLGSGAALTDAALRTGPVANTGPGTPIQVDTWGLSGTTTFALFGCTSSDSASCTMPLAPPVVTTVTQTSAATATIDAPDGIVFAPEDTVLVTAHSEGGLMRATFTPTWPQSDADTRSLDLVDGVPATFDLTGLLANRGTVTVRRCSSYDMQVCEDYVAGRTVLLVSDLRASVSASRDVVIADPARRGSSTS